MDKNKRYKGKRYKKKKRKNTKKRVYFFIFSIILIFYFIFQNVKVDIGKQVSEEQINGNQANENQEQIRELFK